MSRRRARTSRRVLLVTRLVTRSVFLATAAGAFAILVGAVLPGGRIASAASTTDRVLFPKRVRRIVLHVLGSPTYDRPDRRFIFYDPPATHRLWKRRFGAHWIVWVDGTIWPRHARPAEEPSFAPPADGSTSREWQDLLSRQAAPVYGHVYMKNTASLGIEVAHSGRSADPFPPAQIASLAWLLRTLLAASGGRLTESSIVGHKDVDLRPAFVAPSCDGPRCLVFVDGQGRPLRWRVDPPESLFRSLAGLGLPIPRPADGDADLLRAEVLAPGVIPATARWSP
jgi:N-acetylmuramoyl-L-alanine amidase-like protein